MELGRQALRRFAALAREMAVDQVACFATAAVRDAENGSKFLDLAHQSGLFPEIVGGEMEAELAALGVISAIPEARGFVGDLGGGSLELAYVENGKVGDKYSFPLGVLRLGEMREKLGKDFESTVRDILRKAKIGDKYKGLPLYLVGGSWRSLVRIDLHDTEFALPMIHAYRIPRKRVIDLMERVESAERQEMKAVDGLSTSRLPTLPDAAFLLDMVAEELEVSEFVASSYGAREGYLYRGLSEEQRKLDPLLVATAELGQQESRFGDDSAILAHWMEPLFAGESPAMRRIRHAACNLSDVAWRAHPDFRAERGLEIGMHGNWVGIAPSEREMLGQALFTSFGGGTKTFPDGGRLASEEKMAAATRWGMAMRLGQRIGGGRAAPLTKSTIRVLADKLVLGLPAEMEPLYGSTVAKRHQQLASEMGLEATCDFE